MRKLLFALRTAAVCGCAVVMVSCASSMRKTEPRPSPSRPLSALVNGRSIFLTGKDSQGFKIMAAHPPLRTSCAACHRPDGSGGVHLPGGAVSADLRHKAMSEGSHPYTLLTVERAISLGVDNENKPLDPVMPRWTLTPRDLHDVAAYVMTLK